MGKFEDAIRLMRSGNKDGVIEALQECSDAGDYRASYQLANMQLTGLMTEKNQELAKKTFDICLKQLESAEVKTETNYLLSTFYLFGLGSLTPDKAKGIEYLKQAVDAGSIDAVSMLAQCYRTGNGVELNHKAAFDLLNNPQIYDHPLIARLLGDSYYFALGTEQNFDEARKHYQVAEAKGDIRAVFSLGTMYFEGKGVVKDVNKGFDYFIKSGEHGLHDAMKNVAYCYRHGIGTKVDLKKEMEWLEKSANSLNAEAMYALANCYFDKLHEVFDYVKGLEWLKKSAQHKFPPALLMLGRVYEHSLFGVLPLPARAFSNYQLAFDAGYMEAIHDLRRCYKLGIGVVANPAKVRELDEIIEKQTTNRRDA